MKPKRIQLSRRRGFKLPPNSVSVARPSKFGNPFIVGKHGTRAQCVAFFEKLCAGYLCISMDNTREQEAFVNMAKREISTLRGKHLACYCPLPKPGEPDVCHAQTLLRIANS